MLKRKFTVNSTRMINVSYSYPNSSEVIFSDLTVTIPSGIVAFIGQNGTGKSTFMLLASGIASPSTGTVFLQGIDTAELTDLKDRQKHVSLIHQNMEFETTKPIGDLLYFLSENGYSEVFDKDLVRELIVSLNLKEILNKQTHQVSKGEMQRTLIAFSLLYGSKVIMMDEPVFALESHEKEKIMGFVYDFIKSNKLSWLYSVHELELSKKFSDFVVLFDKNRFLQVGPTKSLHVNSKLEEIYETPYAFLKGRELIYREGLKKFS